MDSEYLRLIRAVERCATQLEEVIRRFDDRDRMDRNTRDRVTKLEEHRWRLTGAYIATSILIGAILKFL